MNIFLIIGGIVILSILIITIVLFTNKGGKK